MVPTIAKVPQGRSREGARIEILTLTLYAIQSIVAPVRERGLKYFSPNHPLLYHLVAPVRERGLKLFHIAERNLS